MAGKRFRIASTMSRRPERGALPSGDDETDRRVALALVPVSRETEARLATYVALLRRWQSVKNLVGPSTLAQVWTRHIADSAQLPPLAPEARRWVDMGSGAGFPGLVVAILLRGHADALVHLIESNSRKCAFLREVVRETGAPAVVHDARVHEVVGEIGPVDVVTSRALAPLPELLEMGKILFDRGASGMFLKTQGEIAAIRSDAARRWSVVLSKTSADGRIVMIDGAGGPNRMAGRDGRKGSAS